MVTLVKVTKAVTVLKGKAVVEVAVKDLRAQMVLVR
jgi:hypothetical protein